MQLEPEGTEQEAEKLCVDVQSFACSRDSHVWDMLALKTSDAHSVAGRVTVIEGSCECWMYTSVVHAWRFPEIPANFE